MSASVNEPLVQHAISDTYVNTCKIILCIRLQELLLDDRKMPLDFAFWHTFAAGASARKAVPPIVKGVNQGGAHMILLVLQLLELF